MPDMTTQGLTTGPHGDEGGAAPRRPTTSNASPRSRLNYEINAEAPPPLCADLGGGSFLVRMLSVQIGVVDELADAA